MSELGVPELIIILAIVIVLFGPGRLAGIGRTLGHSIREFRHSIRDEIVEHKPKSD